MYHSIVKETGAADQRPWLDLPGNHGELMYFLSVNMVHGEHELERKQYKTVTGFFFYVPRQSHFVVFAVEQLHI